MAAWLVRHRNDIGERMKYQAVGPKNPPYDVDQNDYRRLIENDPQCVNFREGRCGSIPCAPADENGFYKVEVDHCQSRHAGGDSSIANLQLMCGCANRSKYINPDPNYAPANFFDQPIDVENLRIHQRVSAYNLVRFDYKHLFENPQQLLRLVLLLGWMVGSGKTIGMMAILFAYNYVRCMQYPAAKRAKRVLWLVHQTTLVKSLKHELVTDPIQHNIIKKAPRVEVVEEAAHWGFDADIVVACPQALWPVKGRVLTDRDMSEILDRFDVIIVDEGHYAIDKYLQIMRLAPHALKFAITATPMDANGNLLCEMDNGRYREHFALLSSFSYYEGRKQGIFKLLTPYHDGLNEQYHPVNGGSCEIRKGNYMETAIDTQSVHNIVRGNGVIGRAIQEAQIEDKLTDYDNHIMVRVGSISHAKAWLETLSKEKPCGFLTSAVWSGSKGKKLGEPNHPWMLAKYSDGRVQNNSTRIVITVDIGQFGINNRYCSVIAWVDTVNSLIEIIQRIGRALRSIDEKGTVRLVWNARDKDFSDRLSDAIDYMLNMESRLQAFRTLDDISKVQRNLTPPKSAVRLTPVDQLVLADVIGGKPVNELDVKQVIDIWETERGAPLTDSQKDRGEKFVNELIENEEETKDSIFWLPDCLEYEGLSIVQKELPPEEYTIGQLVHAVRHGILGSTDESRENCIRWLEDTSSEPHSTMKTIVTEQVRSRDQKIYAVPSVPFSAYHIVAASRADCDKLGIESYSLLLFRELSEAIKNADRAKLAELCRRKSLLAAGRLVGLKRFVKNDYQTYEPQLVNALLHPSSKRALFSIAKPLIINELDRGVDNIKEFFAKQISKVCSAME